MKLSNFIEQILHLILAKRPRKVCPPRGRGGARGRDTRSRPCKTPMVGHSPLAPNTNDCMVELPDPKCWHGSLMRAQGAANMFWTYHAMAVRSERRLHLLLPTIPARCRSCDAVAALVLFATGGQTCCNLVSAQKFIQSTSFCMPYPLAYTVL